ncbi:hypothetical protein [Streptomyces sp. NPDC052107]|uniref:hypothetical protein n=1 Tax=Streptomyces sp. NPDC052107 TaxID=3155632 RepID=UPI003419AA8C
MRGGRGELAVLAGMLVAMFALLLWGAPTAMAGGPTSVLVASPESGETHALYFTDKEYDTLQRLLGPENKGTPEKPPEADVDSARQINITWLVHDIAPWRVDRVFVIDSRPRDVWIHTAADVPDSLNGFWHRAGHPSQLRALLKKLGVMGPRTTDTGYAGLFPAPWQSVMPGAAGSTAGSVVTAGPAAQTPGAGRPGHSGVEAASGGVGSGWWWAGPGAAAGAVLALVLGPGGVLIRRAAARRSAGPPREEPRQELIDL